jgi:hypothetical protein
MAAQAITNIEKMRACDTSKKEMVFFFFFFLFILFFLIYRLLAVYDCSPEVRGYPFKNLPLWRLGHWAL